MLKKQIYVDFWWLNPFFLAFSQMNTSILSEQNTVWSYFMAGIKGSANTVSLLKRLQNMFIAGIITETSFIGVNPLQLVAS